MFITCSCSCSYDGQSLHGYSQLLCSYFWPLFLAWLCFYYLESLAIFWPFFRPCFTSNHRRFQCVFKTFQFYAILRRKQEKIVVFLTLIKQPGRISYLKPFFLLIFFLSPYLIESWECLYSASCKNF